MAAGKKSINDLKFRQSFITRRSTIWLFVNSLYDPPNDWLKTEWARDSQTRDGSWILRSVSRVHSKTIHSLFCITSSLPYITLYYIDSRFFCPWNNRVRLYKLPPRSLASSRGCSLAINRGLFYRNWRVVCLSAHVSSNDSVSGATEEAREKLH